jgi:Lon protease-like protein
MFPLFPVPIVLFPGALLPLHIFEPRYRALVADAVAGSHRFGILVPNDQGEPAAGAIGTVARIRAIQPLPDGRSQIVVSGESRFLLKEILPADQPYPMGDTEPYEDEPDVQIPTSDEIATLETLGERYATALATVEDGERPFELSRDPGVLTFQIAGLLEWDLPTKVHFLALRSAAGRVGRLLHGLPKLVERIESYAVVHQRAGSNGSGHR